MHSRIHSFFPNRRAALASGLALATLLAFTPALFAQDAPAQTTPAQQNSDARVTGSTTTTTDANGQKQETATATVKLGRGKKSTPKKQHIAKADRVQQSKDTRRAIRRDTKDNALIKGDDTLPDKVLFDKALAQRKSGHYDIARLDLQTLLNTYPDSQYLMRAKLAVADCWYQEGGSAALTQAEQEYGDFITFFPNSPEASEAQMRIGDIYFKQMDVPDRDYAKGEKAEAAYRTMLKQYPDAPKKITDEASQKLREVQEVLATREAEIAAFYATHDNWPATIARYDTVIDTYPLYSHMDDALIGKGDAYEAEANMVRSQPVCQPGIKVPCLPEGAKAKLLQYDDGMAADAYRKVVLQHSAAPHVEDAKERLAAMNLPIPTPTPEEIASSEALEGSRAQYNMKRRLELIFLRKPDTVLAATSGAPPLDDPPATTAPGVIGDLKAEYVEALNPNAPKPRAATPAPSSDAGATPSEATPPPPPAGGAPTLSDVPAAGAGTGDSSGATVSESAQPSPGAPGASLGVEVLSPGTTSSPSAPATVHAVPALGAPPSDLPAATGAPDPNYGLKTAAPSNSAAAPPIEKPAEAPDQINDAAGHRVNTAAANTTANGKKKKTKAPTVDKNDESSSKKKKKGLDKINPF